MGGGGTGLLAAGRSSVRVLQLYWGRSVSWWSVEVVVGALEIVIRNLLNVRWQWPVRNNERPVMKQPSHWLAGEKL